MASITTIRPIPATPDGALSGHEAICSCGLVMRTSLDLSQIQSEAARHLEWHQKVGR